MRPGAWAVMRTGSPACVQAVFVLGDSSHGFWCPRGGLEHLSRGFFPRVVKSPAACSSAAKTGGMSPASVPERGPDPVFQ